MLITTPVEPATALRLRHLLAISRFVEPPTPDQVRGVLIALADVQSIQPSFSFVEDSGTGLDLLLSITNVPLTTDAGTIQIQNGTITWFRPDGGPPVIDESHGVTSLVRLIRLWLRIRLMKTLQQYDFKTFIKKEDAERDDMVWFDNDVINHAMWADALLGMVGLEELATGNKEIKHGDVVIAKAPSGAAFF